MLATVIAFLMKRPALIGLALMAVALGVSELRLSHAKADLSSLRKADAAALAVAQERQKASSAISVASQAESASEKVRIVTRYKTLTEKVSGLGGEADCVVPPSWVAIWNAGADQ